MPQSPSDPILILGKDAISTAIAATLKLQFNNCHQFSHIPTNLDHQSLILSITSPTNAIAQIHHLRSKLHWEGTFLAIVRTPTEHQQLHNLSIFGELDGRFSYGTTNGQTILTSTSPHLLTDILTIHQRASTLRNHVS